MDSVLNVEDFRVRARRTLPRMVFDYIDGGAEDEITLAHNRTQFERYAFISRPLSGSELRDQSIELFGRRYASPIGIAPVGLAGLAWPNADTILARVATTAEIPYILSTVASTRIEDLPQSASHAKWFQLYVLKDRKLSLSLVDRALNAGFEALFITVDALVGGNRERDRRNGFALPLHLTPRNAIDLLRHPPWLLRLWRSGIPGFANLVGLVEPGGKTDMQSLAAFMQAQLDPSVTWEDIAMIRARWPKTLVIKGIVDKDDAKRAAEIGVDGIVVSNHGGRQLDGAVSPLDVLPTIAAAVGDRVTILCDSGFRRGTDVVKALALGARCVLLGRAPLYGVATGGEAGVKRVIEIFRNEIDRTLALLGRRSIRQIGQESLLRR